MLSPYPMSSGAAGYYLNLAREDYYLEGGEPPGTWHGHGAEALGLDGRVNPDQLYNLFDGLSPDGSRSLVQFQKKSKHGEHLPGWDLTFSPPKSFSVFWSQTTPEIREQMEIIHKIAVEAALDYLEERAGLARAGKGGRVQKAGWVVALFQHCTSRALDPAFHIHALVMNVGVKENGKTSTLSSFKVFREARTAGAVYYGTLASMSINVLGLELEPVRDWFEIKGTSKALMAHHSKRRRVIEKEQERIGSNSPKLAAKIALETREAKKDVSQANLLPRWQEEGREFGYSTPQTLKQLKRFKPTRSHKAELAAATTLAVESLLEKKSHFTEAEFTRALIEKSMTNGIPTGALLSHVTSHLATSPDIVRLGARRGQARYTSEDMFKKEAELLEAASELHSKATHQVDRQKVMAEIAKYPKMSAEQMKATLRLTVESGDLALLSGVAGSGKTWLLSAAKSAWEAEGYRVIGTAVTGKAAKRLEAETGIPSDNLTKLNFEIERYGDWKEARKQMRDISGIHGPNVLPLLEKLANRYGPNIMAPIQPLVDKFGAQILGPLEKLSEKYSIDVVQPIRELNSKYGPNVLQAWHALSEHLIDRLPAIGKWKAPIDAKTIVVLDEASMADTPAYHKLLTAANHAGAKVVSAGQDIQLNPIGPGAPFRELIERHGAATLTENHRQKDIPWLRQAVADTGDQMARAAIKDFAERGLITVKDTSDQLRKELIKRWADDPRPASDKFILTGKAAEASKLNAMAQAERLKAKEIGGNSIKVGERTFYERDEIYFTAPARTLGLVNGESGFIAKIDERRERVTAVLANGERVTFSPRETPGFDLRYASTTHLAQGASLPSVYVWLGGSMQDRELSYTQLSRAVKEIWAFVTRSDAGDDMAKLIKDMERSRQKDMAHTVVRENNQSRGISL